MFQERIVLERSGRLWAKAMSILLGIAVISLAVAVATTGQPLRELIVFSEKVFSGVFIVIFFGLFYTAILAFTKIYGYPADKPGVRPWFETGVQSANAIATLALTYTLLGISLGIGGLAGQELNPTTIPSIIKNLTEHFSMAFMTTVIGLPVSAVLRSALLVSYSRAEERTNTTLNGGNYYAVHPI